MDLPTCVTQLSRLQTRHVLRSTSVLASSISSTHALQRPPRSKPYETLYQSRQAHTQRNVSSAAYDLSSKPHPESHPVEMAALRPLSCLSLSTLVRSYVITSVSSVPVLLTPSLKLLTFLTRTKNPLLNPDRNPVLHFLLKKTFYAQFCAGETPAEVRRTIEDLKDTGYEGVILGHAKEAVLSKEEADDLGTSEGDGSRTAINSQEIRQWRQNIIETVALSQKGDFVALKFTGAGRQALKHLKATIACAPQFEGAVHEICKGAEQKGVRLLFDAEQTALQEGIDNWTMYFAKIYNKEKALVYGTYQAYARKTPQILAKHLNMALENDFVLGIKLVRGAYLGSDPRELFWSTIEETHKCYDSLAQSVMERKYGEMLRPIEGGSSSFPKVGLVLATHNAESVRLAGQLRDSQAQRGEARIDLAYGQLMGMADNVSCQVVQTARARSTSNSSAGQANVEVPKAYKYLVWGQMGECMKYLLRRAHENRDAVTRTVEARQALGRELGSRLLFWRD